MEVREELAAYAHEAWAGWMRYMLPRLGIVTKDLDGEYVRLGAGIHHMTDEGRAHVSRWMYQMQTPYAELPEEMKRSDREEADKMLAIVKEEPHGRVD